MTIPWQEVRGGKLVHTAKTGSFAVIKNGNSKPRNGWANYLQFVSVDGKRSVNLVSEDEVVTTATQNVFRGVAEWLGLEFQVRPAPRFRVPSMSILASCLRFARVVQRRDGERPSS